MEPGGTGTYLHYLLVGLLWTLATALAAWVIALAIGAVVGTLRTTPLKWAVRLGNLYVEIFRNIPLIVQMFLWFFVMPELVPQGLGDWIKQMPPPWGSYIPAVLCLGIFTSVRVAEQVRAGIQSLPRGQRLAGIAMGLTEAQTYRYVVLPQSFRIILPPLTSEFMNIIKNSSVALTIGLLELTGRARAMQEFSFRVLEGFRRRRGTFWLRILTWVVWRRWLGRRFGLRGRIAAATARQAGHGGVRTWRSSCAPESSRSRAGRCGRATRSAWTTGRRWRGSSCRRRSATCCRCCSPRPSSCSRTPRSCM